MPLVAPFVFFRRKYVSVANKLLEDAEQFGCLVQLGGLEPPTSCSTGRLFHCSRLVTVTYPETIFILLFNTLAVGHMLSSVRLWQG